jgi:tripartite-type tricarboxylate transporter receptor subunit TctC
MTRPTSHGRRLLLRAFTAGGATAACALWNPAAAQPGYPSRPIKVVVPFPAGTSPDVIARIWTDKLSKALGQAVVVDNKPGAATIIGTQAVAAAPADGYTLLYTAQNTMSINPFVYSSLPYKVEDLVPVSHVAAIPLIVIIAANSPIKTLQDLFAAAKAEPGKLNFASYGIGQGTHVAMVRMLNSAGVAMTHVPYKDGGISDVINGTVTISFEASTSALPMIKAGRLRALAVSSSKRLESLPDVPAVAESQPGFLGDSWHGLLVSKGTPADVIARLSTESQKIIADEDFRKHLRDAALTPVGGGPADFARFIADESRVWAKVVKDNAIKVE